MAISDYFKCFLYQNILNVFIYVKMVIEIHYKKQSQHQVRNYFLISLVKYSHKA